MRIFNLSLFLWCFLLSAGAIEVGMPTLFGGENTVSVDTPSLPSSYYINSSFSPIIEENETVVDYWSVSYYQASITSTISWVVSSINLLWQVFTPAINLGGWLNDMMPFLPSEFCAALTTIVWIIYLGGIIQFISGRGFRGME